MITVHHLNNSRSQRILWLLEELGLDYDIKHYERDAKTNLAPASLKKVHPLGKSPVIEEGGRVYAETGAMIDYILDQHGNGRLRPALGTQEYDAYRYWLHAAEGSYMPPLVMTLFLTKMETAPMPFIIRPVAKKLTNGVRDAYLNHTLKGLFDYLDAELGKSTWLAGSDFSAADVIMSFPMEGFFARAGSAKQFPNIAAFLERIHARPGYKAALERGGPYALMR
ncbi:glutathione S-transferase family protein [Hyphococcus lacteus]|uniref:Glutathione S-transferase n=1 Tax=Hyphococcus lacteus TaxID=3143536 RepID=A0ABV3Z2S4_9PROT